MVIADPCIIDPAGGDTVGAVVITILMTAGLYDEGIAVFTVMERVILSDADTVHLFITGIAADAVIAVIFEEDSVAIADITSITIRRLNSHEIT